MRRSVTAADGLILWLPSVGYSLMFLKNSKASSLLVFYYQRSYL